MNEPTCAECKRRIYGNERGGLMHGVALHASCVRRFTLRSQAVLIHAKLTEHVETLPIEVQTDINAACMELRSFIERFGDEHARLAVAITSAEMTIRAAPDKPADDDTPRIVTLDTPKIITH